MRRWRSFLVLLLALALPGAAGAEGIYLGSGIGLGFPTPVINPLDKRVEQQAGAGVELLDLGYDRNDWGIGVQWGGGGGEVESRFFGDGEWGMQYLTVSARYLFSPHSSVNPYLEIGAGAYVYTMSNDFADIESDPVLGLRVAGGVKFNLGMFYIATEVNYHAADLSDAEIETNYSRSRLDLDSRVDLLLILVKSGLQARE